MPSLPGRGVTLKGFLKGFTASTCLLHIMYLATLASILCIIQDLIAYFKDSLVVLSEDLIDSLAESWNVLILIGLLEGLHCLHLNLPFAHRVLSHPGQNLVYHLGLDCCHPSRADVVTSSCRHLLPSLGCASISAATLNDSCLDIIDRAALWILDFPLPFPCVQGRCL